MGSESKGNRQSAVCEGISWVITVLAVLKSRSGTTNF